MKETATSCSTWKAGKLLLFSLVILGLLGLFILSQNKALAPEEVLETEELEETSEPVVPFSNGPSGPPSEMRLPDSNPPS